MTEIDSPVVPGPGVASYRRVIPAELGTVERNALARRLYAVHSRIFAGVTYDQFVSHVIDPPAENTIIQLFVSASGDIIGYCAVHRYRRTVAGRDALVLRAEAGLLPEYRGRGATYGFGIRRAIAEKLRHPTTTIYYLGTLVHISSYHLFCKYFPVLFPSPRQDHTPQVEAIAVELADSFPDPAVTPHDPLIRDVGWVTIESPNESRLNQRDDRPDVTFFKARNPGYVKGHGLVVVVPITFGNVLIALMRRLSEVVRIKTGRRKPDL